MLAVRPAMGAAAAVRSGSRKLAAAASASAFVPARAQTRFFSVLPRLRPRTADPGAASVFRSSVFPPQLAAAKTAAFVAPNAPEGADLVDCASSISRHLSVAGLGSQMRCGPRPTMERTSRLVQKRRHGFLSRIRTKSGRKILARRRSKGRKRLAY